MKLPQLALVVALLNFTLTPLSADERKSADAPKATEEAIRQIQTFLAEFSIDARHFQKEQPFVEFLSALEAALPRDKMLTVRLDETALGMDSAKIGQASVKLTADGATTTPDEALHSVMAQHRKFGKLDYAIRLQGIVITRPELSAHWLNYDIHEFVDRVPTLAPIAKMRAVKEGQAKASETAAMIVRFLAESIELQPWEEIQAINGFRLKVYASANRQRQVENLIEALRGLADLAVVINARLYQVDRSFYAKNIAPQFAGGKDPDKRPAIIRLEGPLFKKIVQQKVLLESEPVKLWPDQEVEFLSHRGVLHSATVLKSGKEVGKPNNIATVGMSFEVRPLVSPDRRWLRLHITQRTTQVLGVDRIKKLDVSTGKDVEVESPNLQMTTTTGTIQVPDGSAFLMPVDYRPLGKKNDDNVWLLVACPRIWIDVEEKERQGAKPVISANDAWDSDIHNEVKPATKPTPLTDDEKQILQAVITDILTNPELKHLQRDYGAEKDKTFRLMNSNAVSWPPDFQLETHGYKQIHDDRDPFAEPRRVLGIRVSKLDLKQKKAQMFNRAVEVGVTDANGSVFGGCSLYYDPKMVGKRWTVELCELLGR